MQLSISPPMLCTACRHHNKYSNDTNHHSPTLARSAGGWLYQEADSLTPADIEFTVVSEKQPTQQQLADLKFAWLAVKHVKSNAITVAKDGRLLGMGSGQPNRVNSVRIALEKAADDGEVSKAAHVGVCSTSCDLQ